MRRNVLKTCELSQKSNEITNIDIIVEVDVKQGRTSLQTWTSYVDE
jgi:hypothetical protein